MSDENQDLPARQDHEDGDTAEPNEVAPESDDEVSPVDAVLQSLPPDDREKVRSTFQAMLQYGPMPNPLVSKLSEENLDKIIEGAENDNRRSYEDRQKARAHALWMLVAAVVAFLLIAGLFLWTDETELLSELIQIAVIFAGGTGVGFGLLRHRD